MTFCAATDAAATPAIGLAACAPIGATAAAISVTDAHRHTTTTTDIDGPDTREERESRAAVTWQCVVLRAGGAAMRARLRDQSLAGHPAHRGRMHTLRSNQSGWLPSRPTNSI